MREHVPPHETSTLLAWGHELSDNGLAINTEALHSASKMAEMVIMEASSLSINGFVPSGHSEYILGEAVHAPC